MQHSQMEHAKRVHAVVRGGKLDGIEIDGRMARSWKRCLDDYDLDPDNQEDPVVVDRVEFQERQNRLTDVLEVAKIEMANLYQQLAGSGYAIMLSDRDGVLLDYFGDPSFTHAASRSGLMQGAVWAERFQGTNGMGTCLFEKTPIIVHHDEHYLSRNIGLTCSASPIFNHDGELIAVLDASGESRLAQQHTLVLVNMSVQMIENRVFLNKFQNEHIVRFHSRPEFVGTLSEGVIALNGNGKVIAATRSALFQLGIRTPLDIRGRDIAELFNISLPRLIDGSIKKSFHAIPIFDARSGGRFYAIAFPPDLTQRVRPVKLDRRHLREENTVPPESRCTPLDSLEFGDPVMASNIKAAKRVLERDVAILLQGETGTGKEMFAKAIHLSGSRASKPFVAINCASIPESLIESELFGYKSGAFTGASRDGQRGKLYQANGGTLFLDEIGDMPLQLQARLLRVLEEREVLPLGSDTPIKLDVRLISATHCDLLKKIESNEFREDLYYRIQGLIIALPPLRERADRRALIGHIWDKETNGNPELQMQESLLAALSDHQWPGNVRQLRNVLRTMIALRDSDVLTVKDLPLGFCATTQSFQPQGAIAAGLSNEPLNSLENAERDALIQELKHHGWNISSLAKDLKMSRNTLYRKIQRFNIKGADKMISAPLPHGEMAD